LDGILIVLSDFSNENIRVRVFFFLWGSYDRSLGRKKA
jgi:hypothetical protein